MLRWLFTVMTVMAINCAHADFDSAMALYEKRDFNAAFTEFKRAAVLGDHASQFNIGVMYYRGESVNKDPALAFAWISLAADGGGKDADNRKSLAEKIFANLDSSQKEAAESARNELVSSFSDVAIASKLAPVLASAGLGNRQRIIKKVAPVFPKKMLASGQMGIVDLIYGVGKDGTVRDIGILMASEKRFIESAVNALKAYQFEPAIFDGRPIEVYGEMLRVIYHVSDVKFNEDEVLKGVADLRKKAESGTPLDQFQYAYFVEAISSFTNIDVGESDANTWFYNSAKSDNVKAQFFLGKNLLYGRACDADSVKSLYWLERSAKQGSSDAQYLLAIEMLSGARLSLNKQSAIMWLQRAAEADNVNAQLRLAWIFATDADKSVRNGVRAKSYLDKIPAVIFDKRSLYETRAAVAAELGKYDDAIKFQNDAIDELTRYNLPRVSAEERLAAYKSSLAWTE
jgi:TPR repeat protein